MSRIDTHHHHSPGQQPLGRVSIVGLGLIGGSLGQVLCAVGAAEQVTGWDSDSATQEAALQHQAVHRIASNIHELAVGADLVVVCVPVDSVIDVIREIAPTLSATAVITDVSSAKSRIVAEAEKIIGSRFVGGHPMAGSEESGFSYSSVDLFDAAMWVFTPTLTTDAGALETVCRMADWSGAKPRFCTPDLHDRVVGYLSHLPHIAAFGLATAASAGVPEEWRDIAAGSFKGGTRVALSSPEQWAGIIFENRANSIECLIRYRAWLDSALQALNDGNRATLQELLSDAHSGRKQFPR